MYISRKPRRPGHRQTSAKSPRGSRGPGNRRLSQPAARAARCPRSEGRPGRRRTPARAQRAPARPLRSPLPPRDVQSEPQGFQGTQEDRTRGKGPPPPSRRVPPPPASPGQALGTPGSRAAAPASQRSPAEGASPGLRLSARPAAASLAPAAPHTCRRGPPGGPAPRGGAPTAGPARVRVPGPPPVLTVMLWKTPPAVAAHTYLASQ